MYEQRSTGETVFVAVLIVVMSGVAGWVTWRRERPQHLRNKAAFALAQQRWRLELSPDGRRTLVNRLDTPALDVTVATSSPRRSPWSILLGRREEDARPMTFDEHRAVDVVPPRGTLVLSGDLSHRHHSCVEVEWTQPDAEPAWSRLRATDRGRAGRAA